MEREIIDGIQANKAAMVDGLKKLQAMQGERPAAKNAVFLTLAELNVWHGKASERLIQHFPEHAGPVILGGGGGRG